MVVSLKIKFCAMKNQNQFKFFIVDDDIFCANVYEQFLKNSGYSDITYYSNGNDCLSNLNSIPDIILLDHNMEGITGFEVLKKIKRYNPNIYVIMISGQENINTAVNALKYGAFDYLIKDKTVNDKLSHIIEKIIKIKQVMRESNPTIMQRILSIF